MQRERERARERARERRARERESERERERETETETETETERKRVAGNRVVRSVSRLTIHQEAETLSNPTVVIRRQRLSKSTDTVAPSEYQRVVHCVYSQAMDILNAPADAGS